MSPRWRACGNWHSWYPGTSQCAETSHIQKENKDSPSIVTEVKAQVRCDEVGTNPLRLTITDLISLSAVYYIDPEFPRRAVNKRYRWSLEHVARMFRTWTWALGAGPTSERKGTPHGSWWPPSCSSQTRCCACSPKRNREATRKGHTEWPRRAGGTSRECTSLHLWLRLDSEFPTVKNLHCTCLLQNTAWIHVYEAGE